LGEFLLNQALNKNHKDTFGSNYVDHARCGYDDADKFEIDQHKCDQVYIIKENRQLLSYTMPCIQRDPSPRLEATAKLQGLLDGPLVKKDLQGTEIGDESMWNENDVQLWTGFVYYKNLNRLKIVISDDYFRISDG
jgi:hypothetical protein